MNYTRFSVNLLISIALAFLINLESFAVTAKMEIDFPTGTLISGSTPPEYKVELRMQGATPTSSRLRQCTGFKLTDQLTTPIYAVQFTGHAPSTIVHHLVLYGCAFIIEPNADPCSCPVGQRYSLFVSTLNTPAIRFKTIGGSSAGMVIGGTTSGVKYVFIEVHYVSASTTPDFSTGVDVQYILTTPTSYVGIYSIMAAGSIAPGQTQATVDACISFLSAMNVVGYQIHAHSLGTHVSTYIRKGSQIRPMGRWNPQFPQVYLKINYLMAPGDMLVLRCVYNSVGKTQTVYTIGVPGREGTEMCFVNLLYWSTVPPSPITVFQRGSTCPTNFIIPSGSLIPLSASTKLSNHALYGNQTGTAIVDSQTVNLDLATFT